MSEERGEWSVVMTDFSGVYWDFVEAAREAFGRKDFDASGPTVFPDSFLPAELIKGLDADSAQAIAERLRESGAVVTVVRQSEQMELRHRVSDFWCLRCMGDSCFAEIEGLITNQNPTNVRDHFAKGLAEGSKSRWQLESFLNHFHVGFGNRPEDDGIAEGCEMANTLKEALTQAYPDRAFTISHWLGDQVSFWQTTPDSPREPEEGQELIFVEPAG